MTGGTGAIRSGASMIKGFPLSTRSASRSPPWSAILTSCQPAVMVIVLAIAPPLEEITWRIVLVIPVVILQTIFNVGLACFLARLGHKIPDLTNFMSIVSRFWLYGSGVFFSIEDRLDNHPALLEAMQYNPMHAYLTLVQLTALRSRYRSEDVDRRHSLGWPPHRRIPVSERRRTMADLRSRNPISSRRTSKSGTPSLQRSGQ